MADLTFSSILSKYASGSGAPASAPASASSMSTSRPLPASSSTSRPSASQPPPKSRITAVGQSRPSASGNTNGTAIRSASMGNINTASSRPNDRPNGASARNDNGTTAVKKRKLDNPSENLPLTETDKERAERKRKLQEKLKIKKEKIAGGLSGPTNAAPPAPPTGSARLSASAASKASAPAPSTSTNSLAKLSYQELLARAAKLREEKKIPGGITHKARAPVTEKKEWQKKLARQQQQQQQAAGGSVADRKSKSPGVISGGERSTLAKKAVGKDMGKAGPAKKAGNTTERGLTSVIKGKASDKSRPAEPPVKRKRSPSPISWRGRNAAATTTKKASRPRPGRSRYDEEDEEDDWIVDDDEDDGGGYSRRYRYAESDEYDSGSDMEAAGLDILEEEERSRRNAIKEDIEQERIEKELAARKAAMKKKGKK